jgi:hypothetical protein
MRLLTTLVTLVFVLAIPLFPTAAYSEPVASGRLQITTGTIEIDWTEIYTDFLFSGPRFQLGAVGTEGFPFPRFRPVGSLVNPSFEVSSLLGFGELRVSGRVFDVSPDARGPWIFRYRVDAPNVIGRRFGGIGDVVFPFSLTGSLFAPGSDGPAYEFAGRGIGGFLTSEDLVGPKFGTLTFHDAAPIPEPSTLALVAGALALARFRQARRHRRDLGRPQ